MPIFLYRHPKTKKVIEVIQSVHDVHEYIKDGVKYEREFTVPQAAIDTKIDGFDSKKFVEKTGNVKHGKVGDLYNRSKDASLARAAQAGGVDPIRLSYEKDYAKKRRGTKLPTRNGTQIYDR